MSRAVKATKVPAESGVQPVTERAAAEDPDAALGEEVTQAELSALLSIAGAAAHIFEDQVPVRWGAREVLLEAARAAKGDFVAIGAMNAMEEGGLETAFLRRCELRLDLAIAVANWMHRFDRRVEMNGAVCVAERSAS